MKPQTKIKIIASIIIAILTIITYCIYQDNSTDCRNIKKSVVIDKQEILEHELRTNEGFKTIITGFCHTDTPIFNNEYFKDNVPFMYLEYEIEKYTMHTSTDSEGHTTTTYSWDYWENHSQQTNQFNLLNHKFNNISLNFQNRYKIQLTEVVNEKYKNKIANNYIYLDGKYFHYVGDKRISFKGIYNDNIMSVCGEINNCTVTPYHDDRTVSIYAINKHEILKSLNYKKKIYMILYIVGIVIVCLGSKYVHDEYYYLRR